MPYEICINNEGNAVAYKFKKGKDCDKSKTPAVIIERNVVDADKVESANKTLNEYFRDGVIVSKKKSLKEQWSQIKEGFLSAFHRNQPLDELSQRVADLKSGVTKLHQQLQTPEDVVNTPSATGTNASPTKHDRAAVLPSAIASASASLNDRQEHLDALLDNTSSLLSSSEQLLQSVQQLKAGRINRNKEESSDAGNDASIASAFSHTPPPSTSPLNQAATPAALPSVTDTATAGFWQNPFKVMLELSNRVESVSSSWYGNSENNAPPNTPRK